MILWRVILQKALGNGRVKTVPFEIGITPVWYNMDLLRKAGITEVPETFNDFLAMADALKAAGITPTSQMTGGSNAWTSMLWYSHILASIGGPDVWSKPLGGSCICSGSRSTCTVVCRW